MNLHNIREKNCCTVRIKNWTLSSRGRLHVDENKNNPILWAHPHYACISKYAFSNAHFGDKTEIIFALFVPSHCKYPRENEE
jgi:hypothetical protein